jgi:hypothetical protein
VVSESQSFEVGASNPRKKPKNQGLHRSAEKCTKRGFFAPPREKMHRTLGFYQYLLLNTNKHGDFDRIAVLVFCLFIGISRVFGHFKHREN